MTLYKIIIYSVILLFSSVSFSQAKLVYKIHGHQPRPWGYEIRLDVTDMQGNHYPVCMTFKTKPDQKTLDKEIQRRVQKVQYDIDNPEPLPAMYPEIDKILRKKGYLKEGQHFPDDLPQKEISR